MTKKEFVDLYFQKGEFTTKVDAEKKAMAFLATIEEVLEKGDEISFLGFGKFEVTERSARTCRNPQTLLIMVKLHTYQVSNLYHNLRHF